MQACVQQPALTRCACWALRRDRQLEVARRMLARVGAEKTQLEVWASSSSAWCTRVHAHAVTWKKQSTAQCTHGLCCTLPMHKHQNCACGAGCVNWRCSQAAAEQDRTALRKAEQKLVAAGEGGDAASKLARYKAKVRMETHAQIRRMCMREHGVICALAPYGPVPCMNFLRHMLCSCIVQCALFPRHTCRSTEGSTTQHADSHTTSANMMRTNIADTSQ